MTNIDFRNWREGLSLSRAGAAEALGLSPSTVRYYEEGVREDGRLYPIPRTTELACAAVALGIKSYPTAVE